MNEGLVVFLVIAIVMGVVTVYALIRQSTLNDIYGRVAATYGGIAEPCRFFGWPSVRFQHHGAWGVLRPYVTRGCRRGYYTQLSIGWPNSRFYCEVGPANFFSVIAKLCGKRTIKIGSPRFDNEFIVTGSDGDVIRRLLSAHVQGSIQQLRRVGSFNDVYVTWNNGTVTVSKSGLIRDEATLSRFLSLALRLFDAALATSDHGITFLTVSALTESRVVVCQICGEEIVTDRVICRSCQTPHHRECWQYNGFCSTYGCRETRFLEPRARPVRRGVWQE